MKDVEEPNNWEHNPSDIIRSSHNMIMIRNVWKNTKTDAVVVQFRTTTINVGANKYVELFKQPEDYEDFIIKIKKIIGTDKTNYKRVRVTRGQSIASTRKSKQAYHQAIKYMRENELGKGDPTHRRITDNRRYQYKI